MSWYSHQWKPYVPVAERRAKAARELAKLAKKKGQTAAPVVLEGNKIARTFWGKAWCDNLEAYSDFANRLPRGRTYVRNGSVVDLQIAAGKVTARVAGSSLYKIEVKIKPLTPRAWQAIQAECAGKIDSLIELLQGKLSAGVMQVVTRQEQGLFPTPKDIDLDCSCPDWADLCKHVAAALYGVGARLDTQPELLFQLRGVDASDLISRASASEAVRQTGDAEPAMSEAEMADVFGIEMAAPVAAPVSAAAAAPPEVATAAKPKVARKVATKPKAKVKAQPEPAAKKAGAPKSRLRKLSAAARARIEEAQKLRWAAAKAQWKDKPPAKKPKP